MAEEGGAHAELAGQRIQLDGRGEVVVDAGQHFLHGLVDHDGLAGQQTIPFSYAIFTSNPMFGLRHYINAYIDFSNLSEEDRVAYKDNPEMLPGSKELFKKLNQWVHDSLVYENFAVDTDGTLSDTYMTQGYMGCFLQQWDQPWRPDKSYQAEMAKNNDAVADEKNAAAAALAFPGYEEDGDWRGSFPVY